MSAALEASIELSPRDPATAAADIAVGRRVLEAEAAGVQALAAALDQSFALAVAYLDRRDREGHGSIGRVVVTGMGKSGHVARKIAATLASTGTPALFVHPAEASHGDLGMIVAGDAILALSNSGETAELADLVAHARRFALRLIAITRNAASTLARQADVVLVLPPSPEACPMGLAPTTSTTQQIALGDALAVALLTRRGFGASDFRGFHPGGKLGAKLRRVAEVMHGEASLPLADGAVPMHEALLTMTAKRFGCLGVIDDAGLLCGIVTAGDLRRAMGPDLLDKAVTLVMTKAPRTIGAEALAAEALALMNDPARPVTALFVVDDGGRPVGILHIHDLLRAGVA